jgi:phosphomannomutase
VPADKDYLVLFDMDGTLTAARKKADWTMVNPLRTLSEFADIGIVTGSPMVYLEQQCEILWSELGSVNVDCISLFPCNGTQSYSFSPNKKKWVVNSSTNMRDHISDTNYRNIVREILSIQANYADRHHSMPLTGNFISDRKSMINWCPVGRDAEDSDRKAFQIFDKKHQCRKFLIRELEETLDYLGISTITSVMGGNTSIDIYPEGWDKTYVLRHVQSYEAVYFIGDRCDEYGNDRTLYEALEPGIASFETTGPENTISHINHITNVLRTTQNV